MIITARRWVFVVFILLSASQAYSEGVGNNVPKIAGDEICHVAASYAEFAVAQRTEGVLMNDALDELWVILGESDVVKSMTAEQAVAYYGFLRRVYVITYSLEADYLGVKETIAGFCERAVQRAHSAIKKGLEKCQVIGQQAYEAQALVLKTPQEYRASVIAQQPTILRDFWNFDLEDVSPESAASAAYKICLIGGNRHDL